MNCPRQSRKTIRITLKTITSVGEPAGGLEDVKLAVDLERSVSLVLIGQRETSSALAAIEMRHLRGEQTALWNRSEGRGFKR